MSTSIFHNESDESPCTVIKQTMSVSLNDDGEAVVSFATNRGKGSGAQTMPVGEFREYVETLSDIAANGIPEEAEEQISAAESVRRTIAMKDGIVSFRVRSGKGAKPAKVPSSDLGDVVSLLASTVDAVEKAGKSLA
jgi:hypothetical protein